MAAGHALVEVGGDAEVLEPSILNPLRWVEDGRLRSSCPEDGGQKVTRALEEDRRVGIIQEVWDEDG